MEQPDPYKWHAITASALAILTLPAIVAIVSLAKPAPPVDPWAADAERLGVYPMTLARGQALFGETCATCHGPDGNGVMRLGKPLRNSAYVQAHTDEELFALIARGRRPTDPENTTGIDMPPRGARALSDHQIHAIVPYLRTLQDTTAPFASVEPWLTPVVAAIAPAQAAGTSPTGAAAPNGSSTLTTAPDTPPVASGDAQDHDVDTAAGSGAAPVPVAGHQAFVSFCSSCHGPDGGGLPNLGKPLRSSEFVQGKTDAELMTFIKTGRPIWDAENTTGIDMPPKGGNPALTDDQIADIITYIRAIQP